MRVTTATTGPTSRPWSTNWMILSPSIDSGGRHGSGGIGDPAADPAGGPAGGPAGDIAGDPAGDVAAGPAGDAAASSAGDQIGGGGVEATK